MYSISPDKYDEFKSAVKRLANINIRVGQIFCNVMKLERSRAMSDIELHLWNLDGAAAMEYIEQHFKVE